jgi:hypothetical protein
MGLLLVLAVVFAGIGVVYLFVHALRANPSEGAHGWLLVVPLLIVVIWLLQLFLQY